jgi:glycolate oxidase FAD binding subunit
VSTVSQSAREAIGSACAEVQDAEISDQVDGIPPGLIARPTDTAQVAEVLRAATAHRLTVVPRGRGTKMSWGLPPSSADVLLDVSALNRVLEHAAGDLIVVTQAGARLCELQAAVSQSGQRLALDETVVGASIGGTLATNASGPRRVALGTARDLLIGTTVVRADGVVAKAGGRVVKNVAGYDVGKLMIGSLGTLAVITEAIFRLHPLQAAHRWVTVPVADPGDAQLVVQSVLQAQTVPAAIEVDWPFDGAATRRGSVSVLVEGRDQGVESRTKTVRSLLGDTSTESFNAPFNGETYPWDVTARGDERATALKLTFVLSGLRDVLATADDAGVPVAVRGSAGSGVAYAAVGPKNPVEAVAVAVNRLRRACADHGGTTVVVDAPSKVKAAVDVWGPVPALDLMRRVKDQFDPDRRLAPGRLMGGI